MKKAVLIGALLFVVFAVVFAPASAIRVVLPQDSGIELLQPGGTLWNGAGNLYLGGQPAGRATWSLRPGMLLRAALGYRVTLEGPDHDLAGTVALATGRAEAELSGRAAAAFANRWLAPYDISITGELQFHEAVVQVPYDFPDQPGLSKGSLTWAGGPVRYRLAGRALAGTLPPLVAYLGDGLETNVYPQDGQTPLLKAQILGNGFVRIGVTQLLTELAGNPWPGSHQDHEVVLEVEEQLF